MSVVVSAVARPVRNLEQPRGGAGDKVVGFVQGEMKVGGPSPGGGAHNVTRFTTEGVNVSGPSPGVGH
ncbi:hypothetical protein MUK42_08091 [Musa troglodytarum]|uniref:Uncharacterized protein n=1 Tax=Musa troglodytarum TaxID=320322 RepID=A0A9E7I2K4_9LILI|nr:hypothetical protein MUK42_08091 [Musa troglodytarum]